MTHASPQSADSFASSPFDELPQLWNVFIGDMSLVGPRPPLAEEVDLYEDIMYRRLLVNPGLPDYGRFLAEAISPGMNRYVLTCTTSKTGL